MLDLDTDPTYGRDVQLCQDSTPYDVWAWRPMTADEIAQSALRDCATLGPCTRMLSDEPCDCRH